MLPLCVTDLVMKRFEAHSTTDVDVGRLAVAGLRLARRRARLRHEVALGLDPGVLFSRAVPFEQPLRHHRPDRVWSAPRAAHRGPVVQRMFLKLGVGGTPGSRRDSSREVRDVQQPGSAPCARCGWLSRRPRAVERCPSGPPERYTEAAVEALRAGEHGGERCHAPVHRGAKAEARARRERGAIRMGRRRRSETAACAHAPWDEFRSACSAGPGTRDRGGRGGANGSDTRSHEGTGPLLH